MPDILGDATELNENNELDTELAAISWTYLGGKLQWYILTILLLFGITFHTVKNL